MNSIRICRFKEETYQAEYSATLITGEVTADIPSELWAAHQAAEQELQRTRDKLEKFFETRRLQVS